MGEGMQGGERCGMQQSEPQGSFAKDETAKINKRKIGAAGETAALSVYLEHGYSLVVRNWHFKRLGEIDLILFRSVEKNGSNEPFLVVCEVKLRDAKNLVAEPCAAVSLKKQNKIRQLTSIFIQQNRQHQSSYIRFDVAEVFSRKGEIIKINIIENAF